MKNEITIVMSNMKLRYLIYLDRAVWDYLIWLTQSMLTTRISR